MGSLHRTGESQSVHPMSGVKQDRTGEPAGVSSYPLRDFRHIPLYPRFSRLQAKLMVGSPDDIYEREADSVAQRVMRMSGAGPQHTCDCGGTCSACRKTQSDFQAVHLRTKPLASKDEDIEQAPAPAIVEDVLALPGDPLDTTTRSFMESRFGHNFGGVRIHTDQDAAESARAVQARAYTVGNKVVFAAGQYLPGTQTGQTLLAHELTHVIQQQAAPSTVSQALGGESVKTGTANRVIQRDDDHKHKAGFGNKPHAVSASQVKKMEAQEREDSKALDILVPFINLKGNAFLDQWLTQMISAKSDASAQVEDGSEYWIVALLGNLLWAASCFVPGAGIVVREVQGFGNLGFKAGAAAMAKGGVSQDVARAAGAAIEEAVQPGMSSLGKVMYATMSTGGGIAASGIAQRWAADPSGDPTGKDVIAAALNTQRGELGRKLKGNVEMLAYDFVRSGFDFKRYQDGRQKYLDTVEQAVWANLFPSIAPNDLTAIYKSGLNSIGKALDEFKHQYREWKEYTQRCAMRFTPPTTQYPHDTKDWPESIKRGTEQPLEYCQRRLPFKPKLHFE